MQNFIVALLTSSVVMSVLALLYIAVEPLLAKRYSQAGRYYAWLIIVIGLIFPFRPQLELPRFSIADLIARAEANTTASSFGASEATTASAYVSVPALMEIEIPSGLLDASASLTLPQYSVDAPVPQEFNQHWNFDAVEVISLPSTTTISHLLYSFPWLRFAGEVWLIGFIFALAVHAERHFKFTRAVKRYSEEVTDNAVLALFERVKSQMGINQEIGLFRFPYIGTPMLVGFIRPRILLPESHLTREELRFILKHELVHYQRKDLYYKGLVLLATAMHWFNPIVYLMARAIEVLCELSCDAKTMNGKGLEARQKYSITILGVARGQLQWKTNLSTNFYGGKKGMKNRIMSIMDSGKKKIGITLFGIVLAATVVAGVAFSTGTVAAEEYNNYETPAILTEEPKEQNEPDWTALWNTYTYDRSEGWEDVRNWNNRQPVVPASIMSQNRSNYPFACEMSRQLVDDFLLQSFPSMLDLMARHDYYAWQSTRHRMPSSTVPRRRDGESVASVIHYDIGWMINWHNNEYRDPSGNLLAQTEFGIAIEYYLLDFDGSGIPEVMVEFVNFDGEFFRRTSVLFHYSEGEFRPVSIPLYRVTLGTDLPPIAPFGEYVFTLPSTPNFVQNPYDPYSTLSEGSVVFILACEAADISGQLLARLNNGVLEIEHFQPFNIHNVGDFNSSVG